MKVFLSYSRSDRVYAQQLADKLADSDLQVWHPDMLEPGQNWGDAIGNALRDSQAMVVLLSPEALESPYFKSEIDYALSSPEYEGRLIPVMVRPTANIPWILRKLKVMRATKNPSTTGQRIAQALKQSA